LPLIERYTDNGVAIITLSNSDNGNRLNSNSLKELNDSIDSSLENKDARVVVLRSNGKNFCLGMDLDFLVSSGKDIKLREKTLDLYVNLLKKIYTCEKPVIALVNGDVKAGGVGLVAACDIVIASEISTFELSEVLFGIIPANVLPFILSLRISPQKARYLVITAKKIDAIEAKNINLVDEVFSIAEIEKGLKGILKTIFRASPDAIKETKKITYSILNMSIDDACEQTKKTLLEIINKPEVLSNIKSFMDGELPSWFKKIKLEKNIVL